jgi:hypothetical protein
MSEDQKRVYVLLHTIQGDETTTKMIGVFDSEDAVNAAIQDLSTKPGFCEDPEGFEFGPYIVNMKYWGDGFEPG